MKRILRFFLMGICLFMISSTCQAAVQDKYPIPAPYAQLEKQYLQEYPELQKTMDDMVLTTEKQMAKPQNDILHNRICTALVYQMAKHDKLSKKEAFLLNLKNVSMTIGNEAIPIALIGDIGITIYTHAVIITISLKDIDLSGYK